MDRLQHDLVETAVWARTPQARVERIAELSPDRGVTRPSGSEADKLTRDYAVARMKEAGLEVSVDGVGNIFARKEGTQAGAGTVMFGSHLDSVVNGGMFDGALGVFTAVETIRRLNDEGFKNERSLEVVAFTGEEGSAFSPTLLGSSVLIGRVSLEEAWQRRNGRDETLAEALERIGYKGAFHRTLDDVEYFIEPHIEQGPILDREGLSIGVVENIVGIAWIMVTIIGQSNHAGTTPMNCRRDALLAAAEIVAFVNRRANEMVKQGYPTVGTVGKLNAFPGGVNIIPGRVEMGVDIRDVSLQRINGFRDEVFDALEEVEKKYGVETRVERPELHHPVELSDEVVGSLHKAAAKLGLTSKKLHSGAGHDCQNMAAKVKAGMIFVPSVGGVSHSPLEWTKWEDVENGARVLTETVRTLSYYC